MVGSSTLVVLAALVASALPTPKAATTAARLAPAPRALFPRFDLTYFPKVGGQGVIGIRPAEIAKYASGPEIRQASQMVLALYSQLVGGFDLSAGDPPAFGDLEQCVFCLQMQITAPKDGERASFALGGVTPGLMRTVQPYDWEALLRKWFPRTVLAKHAGRAYLQIRIHVSIPLPPGSEDHLTMAAYLPDNRTLVLGSEDQIRGLLDRLATGKPAPKGPPGWREVERDFAAFVLDNREVPLVSGQFPEDYAAAKEVETLSGSIRALAVGLSVGDTTRLRVVATARTESGARNTAQALRGVFGLIAGGKREGEPDRLEEFAVEMAKHAEVNSAGRRVTGSLSADGNVVKVLLALLRGPA